MRTSPGVLVCKVNTINTLPQKQIIMYLVCASLFQDVVNGKIYFLLVRIKLKHMEVEIRRRETTGASTPWGWGGRQAIAEGKGGGGGLFKQGWAGLNWAELVRLALPGAHNPARHATLVSVSLCCLQSALFAQSAFEQIAGSTPTVHLRNK